MRAKKDPGNKPSLKIVEGVAGVWHYHLSKTGENYQPALCGKIEVMRTEIPLDTWGMKGGNVPSSYCSECYEAYKKEVGEGDIELTEDELTALIKMSRIGSVGATFGASGVFLLGKEENIWARQALLKMRATKK